MRDGVRIAVDVVLPAGVAGKKYPAVLEMTRYWRGTEGNGPSDDAKRFVRNGFAYIIGDVRGTGASFGKWCYHRSRAETLDFGEIIDWITKQPWSDGKVVGYGVSHSANTADWMAERGRRTLKAIVPCFPDYDPYADLYFPGGVANTWMAQTWGEAVKEMDLGIERHPDGSLAQVRPVDADRSKKLLAEALADHRGVPSVWIGLGQINFRDGRPATWHGASMDDWSIFSMRRKIEATQIPIQTWGSWFDAGTANGVLHRFMSQSNPQRSFIGAWSHGGVRGASPYAPRDSSPDPPLAKQEEEDLCFIQNVINSQSQPLTPKKILVYYTIGEERWKTTTEWPLPDTKQVAWFFGPQKNLQLQKPATHSASDQYKVDFSATTGATNRWHTNGGVPEVWYGDRTSEDRKLLTYTSAPLTRDTEITGQPIMTLYVASDRKDGNFFAYLEDVAPDGYVRYLTEGELRGIDRKVEHDRNFYRVIGPYHSFRSGDAMPMKPGWVTELTFSMMPISVLIRVGHRIRISLAGADADTFKRIPATGSATWDLHRDLTYPSHVVLPTIVGRIRGGFSGAADSARHD